MTKRNHNAKCPDDDLCNNNHFYMYVFDTCLSWIVEKHEFIMKHALKTLDMPQSKMRCQTFFCRHVLSFLVSMNHVCQATWKVAISVFYKNWLHYTINISCMNCIDGLCALICVLVMGDRGFDYDYQWAYKTRHCIL